MKLSSYLYCTLFIFTTCTSEQQTSPNTKSSKESFTKDTSPSANSSSSVKKLSLKHFTKNNHYYKLTQASDSTFRLTWGSNKLDRFYEEDIDFFVADRLELAWDSKDYLILDYNIGSGEWKSVVLPLNKDQPVQVVDNGFCFDSNNNLLGVMQSNDTVLYVQNLQTLQKLFVIEKDHPCDIPNNFYCIDTISISNKTLYYKWNVSNNKIVEKRIRLLL